MSDHTANTLDDSQIAAQVNKIPADRWLKDEYAVYGQYAVFHRALLDEDGLKPVNRRIIWDMFTNGNLPTSGYVKASRVIGSTMGRFHPHGDSSIADALARMAQDFSLRVPLVDKSGSVGHTYGDSAAAPRYWEARLTRQAVELVREAKDGAAEMIPNYDGTEEIPRVLPAKWPNDLVNGTVGIAVGFASKIPSHNPDEVIDAAIAVLRNPELTVDELIEIMPGPDFPTGGEVVGVDGIKDYYETGSGSFLMRARYEINSLPRGRTEINFYEFPYLVSAEQVQDKINAIRVDRVREVTKGGKKRKEVVKANSVIAKNLSKVQNLSDKRNGLKFVVTTTQGGNYKALLNELFAETGLQTPFSANCTVLNQSTPMRIGVLEMLQNFVNLRRECTIARSKHRIDQIGKRLHHLDAVLSVLVDIDKAIAIIRNSKDSETAQKQLMKSFNIDSKQADFILSMRLRKLTKSDAISLNSEKKNLIEECEKLKHIIVDADELDKVIEADLLEVKKIISSPRRTIISGLTKDQFKENHQEAKKRIKEADSNTPCYLTLFQNGSLMKTFTQFSYTDDDKKIENTPVLDQIQMMSQDSFVAVSSDGTGHKIPLSYLNDSVPSTADKLGVQIDTGTRIVGISKTQANDNKMGLAIATRQGQVKIARTDFPTSLDKFPVITMKNDEIVVCKWMSKAAEDTLFSLVTHRGNILLFDANSVNPTGSKAGGVKGVKLKDPNDYVVAFNWISDPYDEMNMIVTVSDATIKQTPLSEIPRKGRGGQGVATQLFKKTETGIIKAHVGTSPVLCKATGVHKVVQLPAPIKRSARGTDFTEQVMVGASS